MNLNKMIVAAVLAVASLSTAAQAADFSLTDVTSETQAIDISTDGGNSYFSALTGRYQASTTDSSQKFNIFCTDVNHESVLGTSYTVDTSSKITDASGSLSNGFYSGGLSSAITSGDYAATVTSSTLTATQRSSEVAWLADTYLSATASTFQAGSSGSADLNNNLSAISLSIWDIVQDGGDGLTNGTFRVEGNAPIDVTDLVSYYQQQASLHSDYVSDSAVWVQSLRTTDGHSQDYVLSSQAVPEVGSFALLGCIAPVLPLGIRRLRRK